MVNAFRRWCPLSVFFDRLHLMEYGEERADVALFMKRVYDRGLTTATGGNVSMRVGNIMLITPSGKDKASLRADDIAAVDLGSGQNLTEDKKLSIETGMHRAVYLVRPDIRAIVHSHPVFASLFSASSLPIDTAIIAESFYLLDRVRKVPYALMGTKELADRVAEYAKDDACALLLENHGAIAFGRDLMNAFDRMECLEQAAKLTFLSRTIEISDIKDDERAEIARMRSGL